MKAFQRKALAVLMLAIPALQNFAQQTDLRKELRREELVESLAETEDGTMAGSLVLEDLDSFSTQPIYINLANEEELVRLHLFNFKQVQDIINYREKYGEILTLKELAVMGNFSSQLLQILEPFVKFDVKRDSLQKKRDEVVRQNLIYRIKETLPVSAGFLTRNGKAPAYEGTPMGYFARYHAEAGKWLRIGLTAENDAGEDFFHKSNKGGFDFYSGFISWQGKGLIRSVVLGDYHLRFGQGVSLWSGGGVSYASDLTSLMRTGEGIRPYSSSDENLFFRGAAVQLNFKPIKFSVFYSNRWVDTNQALDSLGQNSITSFRTDGFHRTVSEMADEKNAREQLVGGYFDFRFSNWRIGLLASFQRFNLPVTNGDAAYKAKSFEGSTNRNFGMDYHLIMNQLSFFGEAGISQNLKPAIVNGMIWKAHPQLSLSMQYRYYDPAFQTFNSGAFAEGSGGRNEEGFYVAFEYLVFARVKLSGQTDLFYFPWMTYQTITPAGGKALAIQGEFTVSRKLTLYLYSKNVQKPKKMSGVTGVPEQWDESTHKWRLHADWKVSDRTELRSRVEIVRYDYHADSENGYLFFQDVVYGASPKFKGWFRVELYKTDSYNSRVFSYENDLLYYYSVPAFYGKGIRTYLNVKWQPTKLFSFYLKGGYTHRANAPSMGSGNDATLGNHRFDWRAQVCLNF